MVFVSSTGDTRVVRFHANLENLPEALLTGASHDVAPLADSLGRMTDLVEPAGTATGRLSSLRGW